MTIYEIGAGMTIQDVRERVAKGAARLDRQWPGWAHDIDVRTLDLANGCFCILGQLRGYWEAVTALTGDAGTIKAAEFIHDHAFTSIDGPEGYRRLQDAWIEAIADRVVKADTTQNAPHASVSELKQHVTAGVHQ